MMSFVGSIVSLDCGESLGTYQGQVKCINNSSQELTIQNAYRNGLQCSVPEITINACDIKELKIIKDPKEASHIVEKEVTPSKLSPDNSDSEVFCPSPVKVVDKLAFPGEFAQNGSNVKSKQCSHREKNNNVEALNGHVSRGVHKSGSNQRFMSSNGVFRKSPSSEVGRSTPPTRGTSTPPARHSANKLSPPHDGNLKNVRFTPTKDDQQSTGRPRRNSASDMKCTGKRSSTPRKLEFRKRSQSRDQKDDCFSAPNHSYLTDFDFEKNLALFDKKAVFEEIENANPDCLKVVETKKIQNYRCDENVLQTEPVVLQQIKVPNVNSVQQFVTDAGLIVPTISHDLRTQLFSVAKKFGFRDDRQIEMVGRSASEMVLQLLGGSTRLNPTNGHQLPMVVVLAGGHLQGAQGINTARQLSNHNVKVQVFLPHHIKLSPVAEEELKLFKFCDGIVTSSLKDLPTGAVDMIVNAIDSHTSEKMDQQGCFVALTEWANHNRAPVLSLDPPQHGPSIQSKWSLSICLPLNVKFGSSQIYLCDLGFPKKIFQEVGIKYLSPFGHKFVIPLYPRS